MLNFMNIWVKLYVGFSIHLQTAVCYDAFFSAAMACALTGARTGQSDCFRRGSLLIQESHSDWFEEHICSNMKQGHMCESYFSNFNLKLTFNINKFSSIVSVIFQYMREIYSL